MQTCDAIHRGVVRRELYRSHCFLPFLRQHGRQTDLKKKIPCQTCPASLMTFKLSADQVIEYLSTQRARNRFMEEQDTMSKINLRGIT